VKSAHEKPPCPPCPSAGNDSTGVCDSLSDRWGRRLRFIVSAGISYLLVIGVTAVLHEVGSTSTRVAYAGGLIVALVYNFLANRHFVFRSAQSKAAGQAVRFVITSMSFRIGEWLVFIAWSATVSTHYAILVTAVQVLSLVLKYAVFRRFIFR
jgi:putative flippase GtrA